MLRAVAVVLVAAIISLRCLLEVDRPSHGAVQEISGPLTIDASSTTASSTTASSTTASSTTGSSTSGSSTTGLALSSSATSAFHGGGVGAHPGAGAAIRTDIMVMVTRLATATVPRTVTVMATAMEAINTATMGTAIMGTEIVDTAIAADPEWLSYSAGSLAPAITTVPLTASWDRRRDEQSERTNRTTGTQVNLVFQ